jgi:lysozyme
MKLLTALVKRFEGYARKLPDGRCATYLCSAGVLTLGHGATGVGVAPGVTWTSEQAEQRLQSDLSKFSRGVAALSPELADEPEARRTAIESFNYNCGLGAYRDSTLRKCVNRQNWQEAKRQLLRWDKVRGKPVKGLTLRRQLEAEMLFSE